MEKNEEIRIRRGNRRNFYPLKVFFFFFSSVFLREERKQVQGLYRKQMREEKGDFRFIAGIHVSLIKRSNKGLELFIILHGMYSFSPETTLGLIHTSHVLNELFTVFYHFLSEFNCFTLFEPQKSIG